MKKQTYEGSPIVPVRFKPVILAEIDEAIRELNVRRREHPHVRSTFIQAAVREKLDHIKRSRGRVKKHGVKDGKATKK